MPGLWRGRIGNAKTRVHAMAVFFTTRCHLHPGSASGGTQRSAISQIESSSPHFYQYES
jgi:hypothetical protein